MYIYCLTRVEGSELEEISKHWSSFSDRLFKQTESKAYHKMGVLQTENGNMHNGFGHLVVVVLQSK